MPPFEETSVFAPPSLSGPPASVLEQQKEVRELVDLTAKEEEEYSTPNPARAATMASRLKELLYKYPDLKREIVFKEMVATHVAFLHIKTEQKMKEKEAKEASAGVE